MKSMVYRSSLGLLIDIPSLWQHFWQHSQTFCHGKMGSGANPRLPMVTPCGWQLD
jgi:hypothetical protein